MIAAEMAAVARTEVEALPAGASRLRAQPCFDGRFTQLLRHGLRPYRKRATRSGNA
ncbi:MAG: hypothetical protein U1E23_03310 [Reyranellaceae bacterium]